MKRCGMLHLIRSSAKEILRSLPPSQEAEGVEVQEPPDSNAQGIFQWIRHYAAEMVMKRCPDWAAAAQSMLDATRRAEELIEPQLELEVVHAESDVFTLNTKPSHPQACLGEAATVDTWSQGLADDLDLPEQVAGGKTEGEMHRLELHNLCGDKDHHKIAATLHELGMLGQDVGDFWKAKQHSEDSHSSHAQNHRLIWSQVTSCSELFSQD